MNRDVFFCLDFIGKFFEIERKQYAYNMCANVQPNDLRRRFTNAVRDRERETAANAIHWDVETIANRATSAMNLKCIE